MKPNYQSHEQKWTLQWKTESKLVLNEPKNGFMLELDK
jgi:hypothetical protein